MIKITITQDKIEINGHAKSEICSAVSILSQTLILSIFQYTSDRILYRIPDDTDRSGHTAITFPEGIKERKTKEFLNFFYAGIEALSDNFPNEVQINIEK